MAKFVAGYESSDLESLVALLTDDVFISMPPLPFEYEGREPGSRFFASVFGSGRRFDLVATRANRQPAFDAYVARCHRHQSRCRPLCPHSGRRPDLRLESLRKYPGPIVWSPDIARQPLSSFPAGPLGVVSRSTDEPVKRVRMIFAKRELAQI